MDIYDINNLDRIMDLFVSVLGKSQPKKVHEKQLYNKVCEVRKVLRQIEKSIQKYSGHIE